MAKTRANEIAAKVCNAHRNSDLRADNPAILAAFDVEISQLERDIAAARQEVERLTLANADYRDWARCAHGFAWAHERTCPRHDADLPCACGLDAFLARPRIVMEGYRATLRSITALVGLSETATGEQVAAKVRECAKDRERLEWLISCLNVMGSFATFCDVWVDGFQTSCRTAESAEWREKIDRSRDAIPAPEGEKS